MYNFIPERKNKIAKNESLEKNLSVEELFLKDIDEEFVDNLEKEKTLKKFLENDKFKEIISDIERGLQNSLVSEISSKELGEKVLEKLRDLDQVAYVRFASVYKEFDDIKSFIEIVEQIKKD